MQKYELTLKQAMLNSTNPDFKPKTMRNVSKITGISESYLSNIGKRYSKRLEAHLDVVFISKNKGNINTNWLFYTKAEEVILRLEILRILFNCEITDLVRKKTL